jgi:hypothetical protein
MDLHNSDYQLLSSLYNNIDIIQVRDEPPFYKYNEFELNGNYDLVMLTVAGENETLSEKEKNQLDRILTFLQQTFDIVPVFVCGSESPLTIADISSKVRFKNLIIFGGNRKLQAIHIEKIAGYEAVKMYDYKLFFVHALSEIENDAARKKQLLDMFKKISPA